MATDNEIEIKPDETETEATPSELSFHLIKGTLFRVIYVDGAFGGVTPKLDIRMAVFNERQPIPGVMVQRITPEGTLGDEIIERRVVKKGVVREVEADLVMDYATAKSIHEWLGRKLEEIKSHMKQNIEEKQSK
jgi:hypothetical protein